MRQGEGPSYVRSDDVGLGFLKRLRKLVTGKVGKKSRKRFRRIYKIAGITVGVVGAGFLAAPLLAGAGKAAVGVGSSVFGGAKKLFMSKGMSEVAASALAAQVAAGRAPVPMELGLSSRYLTQTPQKAGFLGMNTTTILLMSGVGLVAMFMFGGQQQQYQGERR